jgi:hypothetical protein
MMISITIGTGTKITRNLHHHQALNHHRILLHLIPSLWLPPRVSSSLASYSSTCPNKDKNNTTLSSISGPSQQLKSWESGAKLIKNTSVENQYLEHIRDVHDPSMHLKTIEDELKGTIGKALGKQGQKVLMYARLMNEEQQRYEDLIRDYYRNNDNNGNNENDNEEEIRSCVIRHNDYRKDCIHARWELIVHRQAVGFTVGNHRYVMERFPIGEALPLELVLVDESEGSKDDDDDTNKNRNNNNHHSDSSSSEKISSSVTNKKNLVGQLEWWERIGRWR